MKIRKMHYILMALAFVFVALPAFAEQYDDFNKDGDFYYAEINGAIRIMCYDGAGGAVAVPSVIAGKPVTSIGFAAFADTGITSVTIPGSVSLIREYAFVHCKELVSIDVDPANTAYSSRDGVLYNKNATTLICYPAGKSGGFIIPDSVSNIMMWAFYGSAGLTRVTIPGSVMLIGEFAFAKCTGLTSVIIPAGVSHVWDEAFADCSSLEGAYFYGNAPWMGKFVFAGGASGFTVNYMAGRKKFNALKREYALAVFTDGDADGIPDALDNCPAVYNSRQLDADSDAEGDVCDSAPGCGEYGQPACDQYADLDSDHDGIDDAVDNCPTTPNGPVLGTCVLGGQCTGNNQCRGGWWNVCRMSQSDRDNDGLGDVCEN